MEPIEVYLNYIPEVLAKFGAALLCGGLIGWERRYRGKPSGFRTSILVCFGSVIYVLTTRMINDVYHINAFDPSRIASQIVVGVGFLGAGAILHSKNTVIGLTSAATIWVVAAIGVVIGLGFPLIAITLTFLVLLTLIIIGKFEMKYMSRSGKNENSESDSDSEVDEE